MPHRVGIGHERTTELNDGRFASKAPDPSHRLDQYVGLLDRLGLVVHVRSCN